MSKEKQEQEQDKRMAALQKGPPQKREELSDVRLIRILATDIPGNKSIYSGLTDIKGISWTFSNAICRKLGMNKTKKIEELNEGEIKKIVSFLENPDVPQFLMNRRKDYETGENKHLIGNKWDLQKEFDIKRMKKIKSYKGVRHTLGQPVRGQRTKSHFRANKKSRGAVGVQTVKKPVAPAPKKEVKKEKKK